MNTLVLFRISLQISWQCLDRAAKQGDVTASVLDTHCSVDNLVTALLKLLSIVEVVEHTESVRLHKTLV